MRWVHMPAKTSSDIESWTLRSSEGLEHGERSIASISLGPHDVWAAMMLQPDGIGAAMLVLTGAVTLAEAKDEAEKCLRHMGWRI